MLYQGTTEMQKSPKRLALLFIVLAGVGLVVCSTADFRNRLTGDDTPKMIWYGTLEGGLAEAKRSDRPILLISAAPQCQAVSGVW